MFLRANNLSSVYLSSQEKEASILSAAKESSLTALEMLSARTTSVWRVGNEMTILTDSVINHENMTMGKSMSYNMCRGKRIEV